MAANKLPPPAQPVAHLADRLPTHRPDQQDDRLSLLVYGKPGVGKTVLAGSAEDDLRAAPVLFIDAEGGTLSISHRGTALDVYSFTNFERDMNELQRYFTTPDGVRTDLPYRTVVVDSITELATRCMESILRKPNPKRPAPGLPEYGDWNRFTTEMRLAVGLFRDLPCHVIATALEQEGETTIGPMFPGQKMASMLAGYFNTVGRLYLAAGTGPDGKPTRTRRLLLQNDGRITAKDRADKLGTLPRELDNPSIELLLDRLVQGRAAARAHREALPPQRLAPKGE